MVTAFQVKGRTLQLLQKDLYRPYPAMLHILGTFVKQSALGISRNAGNALNLPTYIRLMV